MFYLLDVNTTNNSRPGRDGQGQIGIREGDWEWERKRDRVKERNRRERDQIEREIDEEGENQRTCDLEEPIDDGPSPWTQQGWFSTNQVRSPANFR
jgi:hypothetical protein